MALSGEPGLLAAPAERIDVIMISTVEPLAPTVAKTPVNEVRPDPSSRFMYPPVASLGTSCAVLGAMVNEPELSVYVKLLLGRTSNSQVPEPNSGVPTNFCPTKQVDQLKMSPVKKGTDGQAFKLATVATVNAPAAGMAGAGLAVGGATTAGVAITVGGVTIEGGVATGGITTVGACGAGGVTTGSGAATGSVTIGCGAVTGAVATEGVGVAANGVAGVLLPPPHAAKIAKLKAARPVFASFIITRFLWLKIPVDSL